MTANVRVAGFDHIVLNVSDVERSVAWYRDELGLEPVRLEEWRAGKVFFPSLRVSDDTLIDVLLHDRSGENADHFCLVVDPVDLEALKASGRFDVADGPDVRFGAHGDGMSLYVRDPDGNVVELRHYGEADRA